MDTGFWGRRVSDGIEADPAVPEGIIRYEVTYNKKRVEPFLEFYEFLEGPGAEGTAASGEGLTGGPGETAGEDEENPENLEISENMENPDDSENPGGDGGQTKEKTAGEPQGRLELMASSRGGDLEIFMECKDEFLKEVKEKRISSYEPAYITEVRILVNPADMEAVEENR